MARETHSSGVRLRPTVRYEWIVAARLYASGDTVQRAGAPSPARRVVDRGGEGRDGLKIMRRWPYGDVCGCHTR